MAFLQSVQKDLQQSLAEQQHLALLQVLRERGATITFDDIRQLLGSALGKRLGPLRVAEVLGAAKAGERPKAAAPRATKVAAKPRKAGRPKRRVAPKPQATPASTPASAPPQEPEDKKRAGKKTASRTKKGPASKAKKSTAATTWSPPGMSPKTAAALARYTEDVLLRLTEIGDWTSSEAIRERVGGSSDQLRLALKKLQARGNVVFQGERQHRRYKIQTA